jgi:WD40 repeat protein
MMNYLRNADAASYDVTCTAEDVYASIQFEADCTVGVVDSHAPDSIRIAVAFGDRVVAVNEDNVGDRAELRAALANLGAATAKLYFQTAEDAEAAALQHSQAELGNVTVDDEPAKVSKKEADGADTDEENEAMAELFELVSADGTPANGSTPRLKPVSPAAGGGRLPGAGASQGAGHGHDASIRLAAFETFNTSNSASGLFAPMFKSLREKISSAVSTIALGRVILMVTESGVTPVGEVELVAKQLGADILTLDFGVKLRHRVSETELSAKVADGMKQGKWILVRRAVKSVGLLNAFAALLVECHANNLKDVSDNTRVFVVTEAHPHFPNSLTEQCISVKVKNSLATSALFYESIGNSVAALRRHIEPMDLGGTSVGRSFQQSTSSVVASSAAPAKKKRVRMSAQVDIVDIEAREVFRATRPPPKEKAAHINVAGTIKLKHKFEALPHDKLFGISMGGADDRFAFASSLGNVYVVDDQGTMLLSMHASESAVWDVAFSGKHRFVTGGEDASAIMWEHDNDETDVVDPKFKLACSSDIYAVAFTGDASMVAAGGLMTKLVLRGTETGLSSEIPLGTSMQSIAPIHTRGIAGGGGDGSIFMVDTERGAVVSAWKQHRKKAPAIAVVGNSIISGSFDSTVCITDARAPNTAAAQHTMKFQNYVTGLAADENHLAACVGDNLYLWDLRNLGKVLGGFPQAWPGLSRAIKIVSATDTIVTASPDGVARFWSFDGSS